MKLLVVLLAVGLSASEKLNRAYLPPPGAKFAGGSLLDLQTPLEQTPIIISENNENTRVGEAGTQSSEFANEKFRNVDTDYNMERTRDKTLLPLAPGSPDDYTKITGNPQTDFRTVSPKMEYNIEDSLSLSSIVRYPIQQDGMDYIETGGFQFGNPDNMPIIAVTKGIMSNYHPNAFGMYGGNPMIIKKYSEPPQVKPNILHQSGSYFNHHSNNLYTSDVSYGTDILNPDYTINSSTHDISSQSKILQPNISQAPANQIRPERLQVESDRNAITLNYKNILASDRYSYSFDTSNGIHKEESATAVNGVKAMGSYSYTGDDGKKYSVVYSADENGFQPRGDHLPTPPAIPKAIQKVIEQAKKDKEAGVFHDGFYDEEKYGHMKYQGTFNRYLQKMQENSELKKRNRKVLHNKINRKYKLTNANKYKADDKTENVFNHPVNDINGHFGIRNNLPNEKVKNYSINNLNEKKSLIYLRPVTFVGNRYDNNFKQKVIVRPSNTKYDRQRKIAIMKKKPIHKTFQGQSSNTGNMDLYRITTPQDIGYFYVPPRKIYIEGRFQDKPTVSGRTDENIKTESVPGPGSYNVTQRDHYYKPLEKLYPKVTSYIANTEKPDLSKKFGSNVNKNISQDVNQSVNNFRITSSTPSSATTVTMTIQKLYGNTLSTSDFGQDYIEGINHQEEIVFPEQNNKNYIPPTRFYEQDENNLLTTPMPSQEQYTNPIDSPIKYETSDFVTRFEQYSADKQLEQEGYFETTPEVPETFEDFAPSTYTLSFIIDGIQTEPTPNIKVDRFGRPIQDNIQLFNPSKPNYEHLTNEKTQSTSKYEYFNYEEPFADKATPPKYKEPFTKVSGDRGSEQVKATIDVENNNVTVKIVGEDFSGPKQSQRYDPGTGYYY